MEIAECDEDAQREAVPHIHIDKRTRQTDKRKNLLQDENLSSEIPVSESCLNFGIF